MTETPSQILNLSILVGGGHTLLLRLDPNEPIFQSINRASCDQLDHLLNLPVATHTKGDDTHFTVIRTAYGNLPVLALPVALENPGAVKTLIAKLKLKKVAFSEKNLGGFLPEVKKNLKGLPEVNVWNAI